MMKIPLNVAAWFQSNLYLLTLSGYSADLFTCAKPGELKDDPKFRWQFAVDMIYRSVRCGLMDAWDVEKKSRMDVSRSLDHVNELARFDPNSDPLAVCWIAPEFDATDLCVALVKKYDIQNFSSGAVCRPFIEEIEELFERNGVNWSDTPLIELGASIGVRD